MTTIPSTTISVAKKIALEEDLDVILVRKILDKYHDYILECLEHEIPFIMKEFGKFYFTYTDMTKKGIIKINDDNKDFFQGRVSRRLRFKSANLVKSRLNNHVHDLGIKNNLDKKEMMRLAINPNEISKIRRTKILEDQQKIGFNSDLLFDDDDMPESDRLSLRNADKTPTVDELMRSLGIDIDYS